MMTDERVDLLSDADLHDELLKYGFANIPVTETTRNLLKNKLKKQIKRERLNGSDRYSSNRAYIYNSDEEDLTNGMRNHATNKISLNSNSFVNDKTTNAIRNKRNTRCFYENPELITYSHPSSKMCVPPPVLASESDSEGEQYNYRGYPKMCTLDCPGDSFKYITSNGMNFDNVGDGGVVSRLLSLRGSTLHRKYKTKSFIADDSKLSKVGSSEKRLFSRMLNNIKMHVRTKSVFSQLLIPYILICTFAVFLILIALVYMFRKYERGLIDESTTRYELCDDYMSTPTLCIKSELLKGALEANKRLVQLLEDRARTHYCTDKEQSPIVHLNDVFQNMRGFSKSLSQEIIPRDVAAALYLINNNPQWKINIMNGQGNSLSTTDLKLKSGDENISFILAKPNLPLKCVLFNKLQRFFVILGSLSVLGLVIWLIYFCVQHIKTKNRNKLLAAEQLSKKIVYELMRQPTQGQNGGVNTEVPIDVLKDKLILINEQKQLEWAWNEALRMVQKKDNRILFGVMMRNGKEVQTVSWNENAAAEITDISSKKKWQSPAFDNSNKIANPPTPCLKIRHMFDSTEVKNANLKQLIIDAIFEKVGNQVKICDIQLDKQSCCVYLRCASEVDAGIVHNKINGWWFDKRLISIKFLRLERYLSRFPQSSSQPKRFPTPSLLNVQQRS